MGEPIVSNAYALDVARYKIHVDRKDRTVYVLNEKNKVVKSFPCGIGKGGLKRKTSMRDYVTPTGQFKVDIVLYNDSSYSQVSDEVVNRYKNGLYSEFFQDRKGLEKLFNNMNKIDFNRDGKPDNSYENGYIGLDSAHAVTGPKMRNAWGIPYWYSIALHGSAMTNIGKAKSGGCVHLPSSAVSALIEGGFAMVGTMVVISDVPPNDVSKE